MARYKYDEIFDKAKRSDLSKFLEGAKKKVEGAAMTVKNRVGKVTDDAAGAYLRFTKGWDYLEKWNYGDYARTRAADICAYLRHASYEGAPTKPSEEYLAMLEECELAFRSYDAVATAILDLSIDLGNRNFDEMQEKADAMLAGRVLDAWMWYGKTLLDPDLYIVPDPPYGASSTDALSTSMPAPIARVAAFGRDLICQATSEVISYRDVENLPVTECKRISAILHETFYNKNTYQEGYYGSDEMLPGKPDDWADHSPSFMFSMRDRETWRDDMYERSAGFARMKSRAEIGVDWCAFTEDIYEAARMLDLYVSWISPAKPKNVHGTKDKMIIPDCNTYLSLKDAACALDEQEGARLDEQIHARFDIIWAWLCTTGFNLWD